MVLELSLIHIYLSSLAIADADSSSANKADAGTIKNKAGNLASLAGSKETLTGTVTLPEDVQAGETIKASYTDGNGQDPMFVWYRDWGGEEQVLGFGESFTVPNDMVGVKVYVKCMDGDHYGIKTAESGKVQGMSCLLYTSLVAQKNETVEPVSKKV